MEPEGKFINDYDFQERQVEINKSFKAIILILIITILAFTLFKNQNITKNNIKKIIDDDSLILDTIPSEQLNNARNSFNAYIYQDSIDPTKTLSYNLFIPSISKIQKYPLVVFIGDARMVGKNTTAPLMLTIGGPIWATDSVQDKNKCFGGVRMLDLRKTRQT
jgi:predicted peptidase